MAMLVVLFIIMAIAVISSGFIARSDAELQCGQNYRLRNEADYLAWAGLEVAWALVQDPNTSWSYTKEPVSWEAEAMPNYYYDLSLSSTADPNLYRVNCAAYKEVGGKRQAESRIYGTLFHDSSDPSKSLYISIRRK